MKETVKRGICLLLAFVMCLSMASCAGTQKDADWTFSEEDAWNMVILNSSMQAEGDRYTATLSYENDIFVNEVTKDDVVVICLPFESMDDDINISIGGEEKKNQSILKTYADEIVTDIKVNKVDAKTLEIDVPDMLTEKSVLYYIVVSKKCTKDSTFACAMEYILEEETEESYAELISNISVGRKDPEFTIKPDNAVLLEDLDNLDIQLTDAFAALTVVEKAVDGENIIIRTTGEVDNTEEVYGNIILTNEEKMIREEVNVAAHIFDLQVYVDMTSYVYEEGRLRFDLVTSDEELYAGDDKLLENITIDGAPVAAVAMNKEENKINVTVETDARDVDAAVAGLFGKQLVIAGALYGGTDVTYDIYDSPAAFSMDILSVEPVEGSEELALVKADLYVLNGFFDGLTASDISFTGSFEGAEILSFEEDEVGGYYVTFHISSDASEALYDGIISVSEGKVRNRWGTVSQNNSSEIFYVAEEARFSENPGVTMLVDCVKEYKSMFKKTKSIVTSILKLKADIATFNVSGFINNSMSILTSLGIIKEKKSTSNDDIYKAVAEVQAMQKKLEKKLAEVQAMLISSTAEIVNGVNKSTLLVACNGWNGFKSNYIVPLEATHTAFYNNVRANLVNFIKGDNNGALVLYYDTEGNLTVPDSVSTQYSVDGIRLNSEKTVTIPLTEDSFASSMDVLAANRLRYTDDVQETLREDVLALLAANSEIEGIPEATEENAEMISCFINSKMSYSALSQSMMNEMESRFVAMCNAIVGDATGSPIDSFYNVMYTIYNFQHEAESDIVDFNNYIVTAILKYGTMAVYASEYNSGYDSDADSIAKAAEAALTFMDENTGLHDLKDGQLWCYSLDKPITQHFDAIFNQMPMCISVSNHTGGLPVGDKVSTVAAVSVRDLGTHFVPFTTDAESLDYCAGGRALEEQKVYFSDMKQLNFMNAISIDRIRTRFENMDISKSVSFEQYMLDLGNAGQQFEQLGLQSDDLVLLTGISGEEKFKLDGSVSLYARKGCGGGVAPAYYNDGELNKLGSHHSEWFRFNRELTGSTYNLATGEHVDKQVLYRKAAYMESHFYWLNDEMYTFQPEGFLYEQDIQNSSRRSNDGKWISRMRYMYFTVEG